MCDDGSSPSNKQAVQDAHAAAHDHVTTMACPLPRRLRLHLLRRTHCTLRAHYTLRTAHCTLHTGGGSGSRDARRGLKCLVMVAAWARVCRLL